LRFCTERMTQVLASAGGVLGQIGANIVGGPPGTGTCRYTVKKLCGFPVPSRYGTYQTLPGWELLNYSLQGRISYSLTICAKICMPLQGKSHLCIPFFGKGAASVPISVSVSVSDLYIPRISPHISLQQNRQTDPVNI
jgi:hypothetical protein